MKRTAKPTGSRKTPTPRKTKRQPKRTTRLGRSLALSVRLVPAPLWGMNLAKLLPRAEWERIRAEALEKAGHHCEVCGSTDRLHADEVWVYDDRKRIVRLERVRALCLQCHRVVHPGHSGLTLGREEIEQFRAHALAVNGCSAKAWTRYVEEEAEAWQRRSRWRWTIDWGDYARLAPGVLPERGEPRNHAVGKETPEVMRIRAARKI
jgi:hypothetical protein